MASQFVFDAIGTHWVIDIYQELSEGEQQDILGRIMARIEMFERAYSRFKEDSLVAQIAREAGTYELPDDSEQMLATYRILYDVTDGRMTPLIGQVLVDAGYDKEYSLAQKKPLAPPRPWDEVMEYFRPHLTIHEPVQLDFGAAGKGYLIDLVGAVLLGFGIHSFCVDAGGDMLHKSKEGVPLPVGLEHPDDTTQVIGVIPLLNKSLCGSAGNRRAWGNFHHIINPDTLSSPAHIRAVWVLADNTLTADALTTALFFVEAEVLIPYFTFDYFILYEDYSFKKSEGFIAELFIE